MKFIYIFIFFICLTIIYKHMENKAFDVLLESLSRIQGSYLWIAGDGPLKKELMAKAEELGVKPRTRFLGWREDVPSLIASGDIFICPSRHEPLCSLRFHHVIERVIEWAQVRIDLLNHVPGQVAQLFSSLNGRSTKYNPLYILADKSRYSHGHRQIGLPRPRGPDAKNHIVGPDRLDVATLVGRPWKNRPLATSGVDDVGKGPTERDIGFSAGEPACLLN